MSDRVMPTTWIGRRFEGGVIWLLLSAAGFGALAIFGKLAYAEGLGLPTLLAGRFSLAAIVMWSLLALRRISPRVSRTTLLGLLLMGSVGYVGQSFAFFTALQTVPAATTGLLLYLYPALVAVLAWAVLRQPLTRLGWLALGLALLGCALVLGGPDALPASVNPVGIVWGLAAAAIYALYIIAGARITAGVPPLVAATYIISAAAVVYGGAGLAGGTLHGNISAGGWFALVGIALVSTVLAIGAFVAGLARLGPARASILSTGEPVVTLILAAVVLGEVIHPAQLLGGALILAAGLLVSRQPSVAGRQTPVVPE